MAYNYLPVEHVIERVNRFPLKGEKSWDNDMIREWIGESIRDIGGVSPLIEREADLVVENGQTTLPAGIERLNSVTEKDQGVPMEDVGRSVSQDFSYTIEGRTLFTSFLEGTITISYFSAPVDERGYPLIYDEEAYIKGVTSYCEERIAMQRVALGEMSMNVYQLYAKNKSYYMMAARNATRPITPDRLANLQREVFKPYSDVRRKYRFNGT